MPARVEFSVAVLFSIAVPVEHRVVAIVRVQAAVPVVSVRAALVVPVDPADAVPCIRLAARRPVEHLAVPVPALDSAPVWVVAVPALADLVRVDLVVALA